jgi:hypothetical protein
VGAAEAAGAAIGVAGGVAIEITGDTAVGIAGDAAVRIASGISGVAVAVAVAIGWADFRLIAKPLRVCIWS